MPQRRRIVFLFGLGIVLPSLLLGYLAFRGVQNDRALLEKDRLEETRRTADLVLRTVDNSITAVEDAFVKTIADHSEKLPADLAPFLDKLAVRTPLVEGIFYLRDLQEVHFPLARLLYVADGRQEAGSSLPATFGGSAEIQAAQRLEFREKKYPGALAAYRQAFNRTNDPPLKGAILNAMARVQKKSGLLHDAISTYENIVQDYGGIVISEGIPLGPSAALEICTLSRELKDVAKSLRASQGLYRSLVRGEWLLEKSEFEFFIERAGRLIGDHMAGQTPGLELSALRRDFQSLEAEMADQRTRTERVLIFQESAVPALEAGLSAGQGRPDRSAVKMPLRIGRYSFLVSLPKTRGRDTVSAGMIWGILFDAKRLREDVLRPVLGRLLTSGETGWVVQGRDGVPLMSTQPPPIGPAAVRADFSANFPDWTLQIHQPPPRLIKTFLLSRRGFYSFVFLLIAGILAFGLVLTTRSVAHELELARMKSDFVSTVSHEFKSPLTSIRQLAEMLQSGRVPSEERRQKYYEVLLEQSERLALLTDNILSLAKIEEGRAEFTFENTDISVLLTEVVTSIQERVRHEGFAIGLIGEGSFPLLAVDRTALSQAVTNLIDNAIKYSGDSRKISVRASMEDQALVIDVKDFGAGIKKEDIHKVFDRFYRGGEELTRTIKGSGLGLTLVKEIVEAHRGRVQVESEPGKGSLFSIRLPLPPRRGGPAWPKS